MYWSTIKCIEIFWVNWLRFSILLWYTVFKLCELTDALDCKYRHTTWDGSKTWNGDLDIWWLKSPWLLHPRWLINTLPAGGEYDATANGECLCPPKLWWRNHVGTKFGPQERVQWASKTQSRVRFDDASGGMNKLQGITAALRNDDTEPEENTGPFPIFNVGKWSVQRPILNVGEFQRIRLDEAATGIHEAKLIPE